MLDTCVRGLAHIGIRVHDFERSKAFYTKLGFRHTWGPAGPEPVAALVHISGLELNLILNAPQSDAKNVLMDVPEKHAGITHLALKINDIVATEKALAEADIAITGRRGDRALFVRDPDRNVIELAAD
jgi:lactoylglutathione lyase